MKEIKHNRHIWLFIREHDNKIIIFTSLVIACKHFNWVYNSVKHKPNFYKGYYINKIRINDGEFKTLSNIL